MPTTPTQTTPTRTTPSSLALDRALAPVESEAFLAEHWERKPAVVPRAEEGRFDDLLSVADVERLMTETGIRAPGFRLVKAGATVSGYTTDLPWRPEPFSGVADVRRVLAEFEAGATIVLQGLHHNWLPLARYCRQLEAFLGHPAQANAYYTPRGSQGLPVHHDTHEVISLQVAGEKRWLVYEPVLELPLKNQRYRSELGAPGEPVLDVTLRASDTIPAPRLAPPGVHVWLRLTAHHGRRQRAPLDRRGAPRSTCGWRFAFRGRSTATNRPSPRLDADAVRRAPGDASSAQAPILTARCPSCALDELTVETGSSDATPIATCTGHGSCSRAETSLPKRLAAELGSWSRREDLPPPTAGPRTRPGGWCSGDSCAGLPAA
jgi:hypothetical protein